MSKKHKKPSARMQPIRVAQSDTAFYQAMALHQSGRVAEAREGYARLLEANPHHVAAMQMLGLLAFQRRSFDEAEGYFRRAIAVEPRNPEIYNNLGNVLVKQSRIGEAIKSFQRALDINPDMPHAHANLGSALVHRGKLAEAISHLKRAIELEPNFAQAWIDIVTPLAHRGRFDEALAAFEHASRLQPDLVALHAGSVYCQLGMAFMTYGREAEAVACIEHSIRFRAPDTDAAGVLLTAYNTLGLSCQHNGRLTDAQNWFRKAIELQPDNPEAHSNYFWCLQYDDESSAEFAFDESVSWARRFAPAALAKSPRVRPLEGRRLRVGYLSPEFRDHPIAYCIEAMLESHDRSAFEIFLYANTPEVDGTSRRLECLADRWRNIADVSDDEAADIVASDGIDILVDLCGHTENNRIGVFARKPAPIQAEWLGYYATTGLVQMDYFICNPALIPREEERFYVEKPLRLAGKAFSFKPPSERVEVSELPALKRGYVTFGCHNYLAKVTPEVIRVWCEVLKAVPGSRFAMNRHAFMHGAVRDRFVSMFAANGIDESRLTFQCTTGRAEYLESLGELDVLLDTFPFNGATSIYEALWMGLPVVTMSAPRMVGHFGQSILEPLGFSDWVANTTEEYVAKARALVEDPRKASELRRGLRDKFVSSSLCDAAAFTREIEAAFMQMHEEKLSEGRVATSA